MTTSRDPDRTRRSILAAAAAEFSAHGLAGARIDAIAVSAAVNKRMLYHYFGSKDGLFDAVLADRLATLLDPPETMGLAQRLRVLQRRAVEHPDEIRLLTWEALAPPGHEVAYPARASKWSDAVAQTAAEQDAGRLSGGFNAAQLELALCAIALFPFVFPQFTRLITGSSSADSAFVDAHSTFLSSVSMLFEKTAVDAPAARAKPRYRLTPTLTESTTRSAGE